jgi:phage repressor protein C with HTH and peptisase S24 domain
MHRIFHVLNRELYLQTFAEQSSHENEAVVAIQYVESSPQIQQGKYGRNQLPENQLAHKPNSVRLFYAIQYNI